MSKVLNNSSQISAENRNIFELVLHSILMDSLLNKKSLSPVLLLFMFRQMKNTKDKQIEFINQLLNVCRNVLKPPVNKLV